MYKFNRENSKLQKIMSIHKRSPLSKKPYWILENKTAPPSILLNKSTKNSPSKSSQHSPNNPPNPKKSRSKNRTLMTIWASYSRRREWYFDFYGGSTCYDLRFESRAREDWRYKNELEVVVGARNTTQNTSPLEALSPRLQRTTHPLLQVRSQDGRRDARRGIRGPGGHSIRY